MSALSKTSLIAFAVLLLLGATSNVLSGRQGESNSFTTVNPAETSSAPVPSQTDMPKRNPRYRVNPDDVLNITFPLTPELNQNDVSVQPDGYINLQGVKSVYVQGMTAPEIEEALKKVYAGTLHDPIISVDLVDFQKPYFLASGQVGKPGQYDLRHETTVSEGIAIAGGFTPTAKTQVFLLHRISPGWVEVHKLNVKDILNGKKTNEDPYLANGDSIFVPEKFITNFRKYIPYYVGTSINSAPSVY